MDQIEKKHKFKFDSCTYIEILVQKGADIKMKHPDYTWLDIRLSYRLLMIFQINTIYYREMEKQKQLLLSKVTFYF
jgi:hypothetical protein